MSTFFHHRGVEFHYQLTGQGRPFAFCHGLTGDIENPKQLMGEVPPGWQLVVWDCRFHGLTHPDSTSGELSFETFGKDLAALLNHLGIASAVVGGVSMGAGVAARFAADHPGRTEGLVLVRPAWTDGTHPPNLLILEEIGIRLGEMDGAEVLRRYKADNSFIPSAKPAEAAESIIVQCQKPQARERSLRLRAMPASAPIRREEVSRLTMPALVIGNQADGIHPFAIAQWWKDQLGPNATLVEVPPKSLDLKIHEAAIRQHIVQFLGALPPS
jgi:pimeloyl-ACP methyl ester carboxylesterase